MAKARSGSKKFPRIGIIGLGHMGTAILEGLIKSGIPPEHFIVRSKTPAEVYARIGPLIRQGVDFCANNPYLVERADIICIAVKPDIVRLALTELKEVPRHKITGKVFVSVAAGVSLGSLKSWLGKGAFVVRIMPNLPVRYGAGVVGVFFDPATPQGKRKKIKQVLDRLGTVLEVKREADLETVTVISGSGPGTVSYLIEAFSSFAVQKGISKKDATRLAEETFKGTADYLEKSKTSAASMQKAVATKGGVTEIILQEFKKMKVDKNIARGMKKGIEKIKKLRRA